MKRLFFILVLLCGCAKAQSYYTDCAGIAGTSLSGTVACANLPAGATTAFNQKAVVNWTYPVQKSATAVTVSTSGTNSDRGTALQTAIIRAASSCGSTGYIINVPAGFTYTAQNVSPQSFLIPHNNCTSGHYVVIQSANLSFLLPQGMRVKRTDASNMPTITNHLTSGAWVPVFFLGDAPSAPPAHWWFSGLEIVNGAPSTAGSPAEFGYFVIGDGCNNSGTGCPIISGMTRSNLVSDIHLDRVYMHSNNCTGASTDDAITFGVAGDASNVSMSDSIEDCIIDTTTNGAQSLAWTQDGTFGTIALVNNEMRGGTETIGFGFSTPSIPSTVPSDIYINNNYIHKFNTTFWQKYTNQRNWIECKSCQRMLVEGNYFDTNRGTSQSSAFQFTPRNSSGRGGLGGCTWCVVQDITLRYNFAKNLSDWISILGANGKTGGGSTGPELPAKRFNIHDNIVENLDDVAYSGNGRWIQLNDGDASSTGCSATALSNACQLSDIVITHNTLVGSASHSGTFWTLAGTPVTAGRGYNIVITNNVSTAGVSGFAADAGKAHPLTGFLNAEFASYTFDRNVITGIVGSGYGTSDFPSPICNFSSAVGCDSIGWATSMSKINFVNYNSGSGGDYHLCVNRSVPSGCSSPSIYEDMATDSFSDNTKEGPSPGANIDAVDQMTYSAVSGSPRIQPVRAYGPVKGQLQELRQWVRFPGYYDAGISDGSGKSDFSGYNSGGDPESWSGIFPFHDLQHDPGALMNLSGANVGLKDNDYVSSGAPCNTTAITDSKAFWGQVFLQSVNNVRAIYKYRGPFVLTSTHLPAHGTSIMWNYLWSFYRPGFVNTRFSVDNSCGGTLTFSLFNPRMSTSIYPFTRISNAQQYPPSFGLGWSEGAWQTGHCGVGFGYDSGAGMPWGFFGGKGWMMHSIASITTNGSYLSGITDGYTTLCNGDTKHYPVTAEFLNVEYDLASATVGSYQAQQAGGGARSDLVSNASILSNGVDSLVQRSCGWYGDLAIRNPTNAAELVSECQSPSAPTMNAGTSAGFDHDYGCWDMTADATPTVAFTLNHPWTSPVLCIRGWNGSTPTISINGLAQIKDLNYVCTTNDGSGDPISNSSSGLLCQFVGLSTNGSGGMTTLARSTRVIITAGSLPPRGGSQTSEGTKIGGAARRSATDSSSRNH
jgi:hypothetical protein